jgi:hypothetical protein
MIVETISQAKSMDIKKIDPISNANEGCPKQQVETMPDQESVIMMEERYGIRAEGIF